MLVLSRRLNEVVCIDGGIKICIVEIKRGVVRLGIEAPPETKIFREELLKPPGQQGGNDEKA